MRQYTGKKLGTFYITLANKVSIDPDIFILGWTRQNHTRSTEHSLVSLISVSNGVPWSDAVKVNHSRFIKSGLTKKEWTVVSGSEKYAKSIVPLSEYSEDVNKALREAIELLVRRLDASISKTA
jgi:hypothetical protein